MASIDIETTETKEMTPDEKLAGTIYAARDILNNYIRQAIENGLDVVAEVDAINITQITDPLARYQPYVAVVVSRKY